MRAKSDGAAFRVGVDKLHAPAVPDIESRGALLDAAPDRQVEDARPRPLGGCAGDDAVEFVADPVAQQTGGGRFAQQALDFANRFTGRSHRTSVHFLLKGRFHLRPRRSESISLTEE